MPDETRPNDGGLSQPAKRGRPRKSVGSGEPENGSAELAGGNAEPVRGTEGASAFDTKSAAFTPIDPLSTPSGGDNDNGDKPRRGRKPGGKNRPKEEAVPNLTSLKIEDLLITACFFLGNAANCPEVHATQEEAEKVGEAYREFAKFHSVGITEKRMSEINMVIAVGAFGIPRMRALWKSKPVKLKPRLEPTPIRTEPAAAPQSQPPGGMVDGLANPNTGAGLTPEQAATPSQMWSQPGDIEEID